MSVSSGYYGAHFYDFEVLALHVADGTEFLVNPAFIRCAANEPVAPVVGEDHAVSFKTLEDDSGLHRCICWCQSWP